MYLSFDHKINSNYLDNFFNSLKRDITNIYTDANNFSNLL